jgi:short subunit dehydrogenase-like uncharacterized protein
MSFLLYGANGYTGKLMIEIALKKGVNPVLAGRTESKIKPLAEKYGLEYIIFPLTDVSVIASHLKNFPLVLNCAGPFSKTAEPMAKACLISKTHYLDITGEIKVFELLKSMDKEAKANNVLFMPGVGFDVVPTDCVAAYLHYKLPDATHLQMAIMTLGGSISHGTVSTFVQDLGESGWVRENGKLVQKPVAHKGLLVDYGKVKRFAVTIPWGDVSTAHHTTGIPNIELYTALPRSFYYMMKFQALFNPILRMKSVKAYLQSMVDKKIVGPTAKQNQNALSLIWGKVTNSKGKSVEVNFEGPEGYIMCAEVAIVIALKVLANNTYSGYQTPAGLFGYKLILEINGCKFIDK